MGYTRGEIPMTNVHGISVSGGSFPAEIWRRFMEPALADQPVVDFREPTTPVSFTTWQRGPTALSYDPYYVAPKDDEKDNEKEKTKKDDKAAPAEDRQPERPPSSPTSSPEP
jgi:membrane peptidoglycan carboxypeptidase